MAVETSSEAHSAGSANGGAEHEQAFISRVISQEAEALKTVADGVGSEFSEAVALIAGAAEQQATVLVSGLGKSGLIGSKISATMASLGIASHPVHPTEAVHGDLGRFRRDDVAICLSHSGETDEVVALAKLLRGDDIDVIAITRSPDSGLGRAATVTLSDRVDVEAGQGSFVAPTSSTTVALAIGNALALAAARRRGFTPEDFQKRHPGGQLGGLLRPVVDLLRMDRARGLPLFSPSMTVKDALTRAADLGRRPGAVLVVDESERLLGILTDGDVRRIALSEGHRLDHPLQSVMTENPRTLPSTALVRDAVDLMQTARLDEVPVVDAEKRPIGILDVQDLVALRLIPG